MATDFKALIEADISEAEAKIKELCKDRKIKIGVELDKSAEMQTKDLAKSIEKGLKSTKIDTSDFAKQIANSFNISDKNVIGNLKRQMDSMLTGLSKTWDGKKLDLSKATGFMDGLDKMAQTVSQNAKIVQDKMGIYDQFYSYFKDKKIFISDDMKAAMGQDLFKEISNANIGKIVRDATKGVSIDSIWGEMTDLFPEHFSKDVTNQVDQIVRAFDVLKAARADVAKSISFADMTPDQQFQITGDVYENITATAHKMIESLKTNITSAADALKTEFEIDVKINTDNIISDVKNALSQAGAGSGEAIKVNLDINQSEIETQIRNAIQGISSSDTPMDIKLDVSRQSLEADLQTALHDIDLPVQFRVDASDIENQIRAAVSAIDDIQIDVHVNVDNMQTQIRDGFTSMPTQNIDLDINGWDILQQSLNGINDAGTRGESVFQRLNSSMREAFSAYSLANLLQESLYKIADIGEKAISTTKELNDIKTDLQMATGESKSYVDDLMQSYNAMGQELGKITNSVAESSAEWLRQGYSIEDTNTLIRDSMMLSELGKLSASDSTQYLTSSMKGYGVEVQNVIDIVSKLGAVDLSAAVDAGGLAEGMARVAVTANTAGISMDKLLGYLAVMGETSGQSMQSIGTAMRTVLLRMQDIKAGKLELIDEDGTTELLSDVETTLKNVGIDLRSTVTEFNNSGEVLDNLASKWDNLNSTQQAALVKSLGGQRQGEYIRILMENYDTAKKYMNIAANSVGVAEEKYAAYLDNLEAKTNSLKSSLQNLSTSIISDDAYAGFLDGSKAVVDFIEKTDLLKSALEGLTVSGGLFAFQRVAGWVSDAAHEFNNLNSVLQMLKGSEKIGEMLGADEFNNLIQLTSGLSESQLRLVISSTALSDAQRVAVLMSTGMSQAEAQATIATMGLSAAQGTAAGTTFTLTGALQGLFATLMANPLILVAAGITAACTAWNAYKRSVEEAVSSAQQAGSAWEESNTSIQDHISKITELRTALDSGKLTEQEAYDAKSQLLDIQNQLSESYEMQVQGIDLVNGSLDEQIAKLKELNNAQSERFLNENQKGIEEAQRQMEKERHTYLGQFSPYAQDADKLQSIIDKYKDKGVYTDTDMDGTVYIHFKGDATDANTVLNDIMTDLRAAADETGNTNLFDGFIQNASAGLNEANDVLDEYQKLYNQAMKADIQTNKKDYGGKTASEWLNNYAKAVENYNNAVAGGSAEEVESARKYYNAISDSINGLLKGSDMSQYNALFTDVPNQLDKAAIKANEFNSAISVDSEQYQYLNGYQKKIKAVADEVKNLDMSDVDFKAAVNSGDIDSINFLSKSAQEAGISTDDLAQALVNLGVLSGQPIADGATDSIESASESFDTFKAKATEAISSIQSVNTALSNSVSGSGLSMEFDDATGAITGDIANIKAAYQDLEGYDAEVLFEKTANGIHINREALKALQAQQEAITKQNFLKEQAELQKELNKAVKEQAQYKPDTIEFENAQANIDSLKEQIQTVQGLATAYDGATSYFQKFMDAESSSNERDSFEGIANSYESMKKTLNEGWVTDDSLTSYLDLMLSASQRTGDSITDFDKLSQTIEGTNNSLKDYFTFNKDGKLTSEGVWNFADDVISKMGEEYGKIDEASGQYTFDFTGEKLQEVADAFGTTPEAIELFTKAMSDAGMSVRFSGNEMDDYSAKMDELTKSASDAQDKLKEMQSQGTISSNLDLNFDSATMSVDEIKSKIEELQGERVEIEASGNTEGLEAIDKEISALQGQQVIMSIQAQVDAGTSIDELLSMSDEELATTLEVDTSQVDEARSQLESLSNQTAETSITVKIDETQFNAMAGNQAAEATVNYKKGEQEPPEVQETDVNYNLGSQASPLPKTTYVNYDLGYQAQPEPVTVKVNYDTSGAPHGGGQGEFYTGTMTSIAYANGTMHNAPWNYQNLSAAYANGKVSLPKDEKALVNELGQESIIRDGVWSLIPGKMHVENLKKGDIILNAKQTEELLKFGKTNSHARAYAEGTIPYEHFISNSYASGLSATGNNPWNRLNSSSSSSSSSSAYNNNIKATNDNTSATQSNTEATKESTEAFDWVKTKLDKFAKAVETIGNKITDYISIPLKNLYLKRQINALSKEISANRTAYDTYMKQAESIEIPDNYKKLVQNGDFRIEEIDTSTDEGKQLAENIKKYEDYYNKALDCSDAIDELNNKHIELYETLVNLPIEQTEKKIEKLENRLKSLTSFMGTISSGGSAINALKNIVDADNPDIQKIQDAYKTTKATVESTQKTRVTTARAYKTAKADYMESGTALSQAVQKQTDSAAKTLKKATKNSTSKATYTAIVNAIKNKQPVSLKGLKGTDLEAAKKYNDSLKQEQYVVGHVAGRQNVSTAGLSKDIKALAKEWNADNKAMQSATKEYEKAVDANEKAKEDFAKAQADKNSLDRSTTSEQRSLANLDTTKKSYVLQNKWLDEEIKILKDENKQYLSAVKQTTKTADKELANRDKKQKDLLNNKKFIKALTDDQLKALQNGEQMDLDGLVGDNVKIGEQWNKTVQKTTLALEAQTTAVQNLTESEATLAEKLVENEKKKLENISNYYDSMMAQFETKNSLIQTYMNRMETRGYNLSTSFYEAQIANQKHIANKQKAELAAMQKSFQEAIENGIEPGTQEYYEMKDTIDQLTLSIAETTNNIVELQASIRDLEWEQFDRMQESIKRVASESDFLIELMSSKELYDKKTGLLTDEGWATMGLHGVNYNTYMAQADKYKEEMLKINAELASDPNNQKLIDRKNALIDAQQQSILAAENEKKSIRDMVENGIDMELDAIDDLIDKYLDAIEAKKSLWEYEKKIQKQAESIASLQKQLAVYQNDNSEEARAKIQEIKVNLKEAQDNLKEAEYDKFISDQKELLENLRNDYEEVLNKRLDNIDVLIQTSIDQINANAENIQATLTEQAKNVGYELSTEMKTIWTRTDGVTGAIATYDGNFSTTMTGVSTALGNIYERQRNMIEAINNMAEKYIQKVEEITQSPVISSLEQVTEKVKVDESDNKNTASLGGVTTGKTNPNDLKNTGSSGGATLAGGSSSSGKNNSNTSNKTTSGGNGKAEIGDVVTFVSGKYYAASDGTGASGSYYLGDKVKIKYINSGSKYPYCITSADGKTGLGWVKLDQLKGYASGGRVDKDQWAFMNERGQELIEYKGATLLPLPAGADIWNSEKTKALLNELSNPQPLFTDYTSQLMKSLQSVGGNGGQSDMTHIDTLNVSLPNVTDPEDFIDYLIKSRRFERLIDTMTVDRMTGRATRASKLQLVKNPSVKGHR